MGSKKAYKYKERSNYPEKLKIKNELAHVRSKRYRVP